MKQKAFRYLLTPFVIAAAAFIVLYCFSEHWELSAVRSLLERETSAFTQSLPITAESPQQLEEDLKKRISDSAKQGPTLYFLFDIYGRELAGPAAEEPSADRLNTREILIGALQKNPDSGSAAAVFENKIKIIKYSKINHSELVVASVTDMPRSAFPAHLFAPWFYLSVLLFLAAGVLYAARKSAELCRLQTKKIPLKSQSSAAAEKRKKKEKRTEPPPKLQEERQTPAVEDNFEDDDRNPVTGLPATSGLERLLFDIIESKRNFAIGEILINNYASYKNRYGKEKANDFLRFTAKIPASALESYEAPLNYLAHVENNRFIFIATPEKIEDICKDIVERFEREKLNYYEEEDRKQGHILVKDRKGNMKRQDFATLSIGVSTNKNISLVHPLQIAHITEEIITHIKKEKTSAWLVDRRQQDRSPYRSGGEENREKKGDR